MKKESMINKIVLISIVLLLFILLFVLIKTNEKHNLKDIQLKEIEVKYNAQNDKVNYLKNDLEKFAKSGIMKDDKTNFVYLSNVPIIDQFPEFPTGCESIALLSVLKYYGVDVDGFKIINNLAREERPYYRAGVRYGGNPERGFLGDPTKTYGYGVYEGPILDVAEKFKSGMKNAKGTDLNTVLKVIDSGNPVQVWVSMNVKAAYYATSWIDEKTGLKVNWPRDFHSLVITGYDDTHIYTSDPDSGTSRAYDRNQFEKVYDFQGKRAIYYEN